MQGLALLVRMSTVSQHRQADNNIKNDQEGMCCFRLQEVGLLSLVDDLKATSLGHLEGENSKIDI